MARSWVGVGLPRHDGEVEGVVLEDDAVLVVGVRGRARYASACPRKTMPSPCSMYVSGLAAAPVLSQNIDVCNLSLSVLS